MLREGHSTFSPTASESCLGAEWRILRRVPQFAHMFELRYRNPSIAIGITSELRRSDVSRCGTDGWRDARTGRRRPDR